jgi:ribosomal protein L25 (general stress protein Ctc)
MVIFFMETEQEQSSKRMRKKEGDIPPLLYGNDNHLIYLVFMTNMEIV